MESIIKELEKEQRIKVQRLDIIRDRAARKLYDKLVEGNLRSPFPLLCEFYTFIDGCIAFGIC